MNACKAGRSKIAAELLQRIPQADLQKALKSAVKEGKAENVVIFLNLNLKKKFIEGKELGSLLVTALKKGHPDIAGMLLEKGATVSSKHLKKTLKAAIKKENVRAVAGFLDFNNLKKKFVGKNRLGSLFMTALQKGYPDIVEMLLDQGATVLPKDLEKTLTVAIKKGKTEIATVCLNVNLKKKLISGADLGSLFTLALQEGRRDIAERLLQKGAIVSQKDLDNALDLACTKGEMRPLVVFLDFNKLTKKFISEQSLGSLFMRASQRGRHDIVEILLTKGGPLPKETLEKALDTAVRNGYKDLVEIFLDLHSKNGFITEKQRGELFVRAAEVGLLDIAKMLLASGTVSPKDFEEASKYFSRKWV